jgi:hypothetical protein
MAEQHPHGMPQPPPGFQRPGVPGAGNLLDPEVRGRVRESLHEAAEQARGRQEADEPAAEQQQAAPPAAPRYRAGPYPHGDVDLSYLAANVPPEPVQPHRARAGRRFYFLAEPADEPPLADAARPENRGPKPG